MRDYICARRVWRVGAVSWCGEDVNLQAVARGEESLCQRRARGVGRRLGVHRMLPPGLYTLRGMSKRKALRTGARVVIGQPLQVRSATENGVCRRQVTEWRNRPDCQARAGSAPANREPNPSATAAKYARRVRPGPLRASCMGRSQQRDHRVARSAGQEWTS